MVKNIYKRENTFSFILGVFIQSFLIALAITMVASLIMGYRFFKVVTSSMSPYMPVGTLVLVAPTNIDDIHTGDVVTYNPGENTYVTHRVVGITYTEDGEKRIFTAPEVFWQSTDEDKGDLGIVPTGVIPDGVDGNMSRGQESIVGVVVFHMVGLADVFTQFNIIIIIIGAVLILFVLNFA